MIKSVLDKYAAYANAVGDYETAALCHLRLNDVESAFGALLRRNFKGDEQSVAIFDQITAKFKLYLNSKPSPATIH